nr:hypothetical protein BVRB_6g133950 [Ipomoea batatas]
MVYDDTLSGPSSMPFKLRKCDTWDPKPPIDPSSTVIRISCSLANLFIRSASNGLQNRASATVTDMSMEFSISAAPRHCWTIEPYPKIATLLPSLRGRGTPTPFPLGNLKQLGLSSIVTAVATMCISSASSDGAMTTMLGKQAMQLLKINVMHYLQNQMINFHSSRSCLNLGLAWSLLKALLSAPTGVAGPSSVAVGKETCLLSLRMTIRLVSRNPALFIASYACPAVMAPSPITEITLLFFPNRSLATAIPAKKISTIISWIFSPLLNLDNRYLHFSLYCSIHIPTPAEMLVELCPTPKASYVLSSLFGKPASPEVFLMESLNFLHFSEQPDAIVCVIK